MVTMPDDSRSFYTLSATRRPTLRRYLHGRVDEAVRL